MDVMHSEANIAVVGCQAFESEDAVDEDVGQVLREKNPNPRFLKNHHQWLKEHGREKVNNQIQRVIVFEDSGIRWRAT